MEKQQKPSGLVLRIEKSSIHDGAGLRTVVFLQGCNLRCTWCSTPESQPLSGAWGFDQARCRECGRCLAACPQGALTRRADGFMLRHTARCNNCGNCLESCVYQAHLHYGRRLELEQVLEQILQDEVFYFHSGGGLTLSGGEPLLQPDFCEALLRACRNQGINTAIETSLAVPWPVVAQVLPHLDTLFADLKHCEAASHLRWVGVENGLVLENIRRADAAPQVFEIVVRVPLIPGVNDGDENLLAAAAFCSSLNKCVGLQLLPYHRLGSAMYAKLNRPYPLADLPAPKQTQVTERREFIRAHYPRLCLLA